MSYALVKKLSKVIIGCKKIPLNFTKYRVYSYLVH